MKTRKEIIIALAIGFAIIAWYLQGFWAALAVIAVFLLLFFRDPIFKFVAEVKVELDKCSWPWDPNQTAFTKKYKELIESTVVVIISVVLLAGYVSAWDFLLNHVVGALTGTAFVK
jgi:preprotein translocase subunit SecE